MEEIRELMGGRMELGLLSKGSWQRFELDILNFCVRLCFTGKWDSDCDGFDKKTMGFILD